MRKSVAIINITLPLEDAKEFHDPEEMRQHLQKVVGQVTFPEHAHVTAFYTWVPDPAKDANFWQVQYGFNDAMASPEDQFLFEQ